MLVRLTSPLIPPLWRHCRWGVAASCAVHGLLLAALAQIVNMEREQPLPFHISSAWRPQPAIEALDLPAEAAFLISPTAGGSGILGDQQTPIVDWLTTTELPEFSVAFNTAVAADGALRRGTRTRTSRGEDASGGSGTGSGSGVGAGSSPGFFGIVPGDGSRVVFVVDSSRSMNQQHDSPLKTRFRRTKFELMKCIVEMQANQSFFVVFFSDETTPMPARSMQPAAPGVREPFLEWIGQVPAGGGPTDPRGSLRLALLLQPDVICFLTDGEFADHISRQLKSLRQDRTIIHTFAFGETYGEETLKALAANNRGEYRFVP